MELYAILNTYNQKLGTKILGTKIQNLVGAPFPGVSCEQYYKPGSL